MMICGFDSNWVSKSLKFCRRENRFIPFGSHVHGHSIWSKVAHFIRMRVPIYVISKSDAVKFVSQNKHNVEVFIDG